MNPQAAHIAPETPEEWSELTKSYLFIGITPPDTAALDAGLPRTCLVFVWSRRSPSRPTPPGFQQLGVGQGYDIPGRYILPSWRESPVQQESEDLMGYVAVLIAEVASLTELQIIYTNGHSNDPDITDLKSWLSTFVDTDETNMAHGS